MSSKKRTSSSSSSSSAKKARFGADTNSDSVDPASRALDTMNTWQVEEEIAETMIPVIGRMYRRENVVLTLFNHSLASLSPMDIIKLHATTRDHRNRPVKITDTWPIIEALQHRRLSPMRVDIGQLSLLVAKARKSGRLLSISDEVGKYVTASEEKAVRTNPMESARDVVLYGFGRIGRLLARLLIEKTGTGSKLRLRAIVVRKSSIPDLAKRANLLMTDSVHSTFNGRVEIDLERNVIIANGNTIHLIYSKGPDQVDYTKYGINNAVVVDNTGKKWGVCGCNESLEWLHVVCSHLFLIFFGVPFPFPFPFPLHFALVHFRQEFGVTTTKTLDWGCI
jgi:glyceraldehyde 3-phosphate dehydrogenase